MGNATNQLNSPHGLFVDDDQTLVIADYYNNRIIQLKKVMRMDKLLLVVMVQEFDWINCIFQLMC